MSRYFTWFPIIGLGEPKYILELGLFYNNWGFIWWVSDCEELDGQFQCR